MSRGLRFASVNDMPEGMRRLMGKVEVRTSACDAQAARVIAGTTFEHLPSPHERTRALGRLPTGTMNKTEARYAQHLEFLKSAGEVTLYRFEKIKLWLGKATNYTPDFEVMFAGGRIEFHEVKGHWEDDARVKIKIAAAQYPEFAFRAIQAVPKKHGGGWKVEDF